MSTNLHVFTERGLAEFKSRLVSMRLTGVYLSMDDLLTDPVMAKKISNIGFEFPESFADRKECGVFFCDLFARCSLDLKRANVNPSDSVLLWSWLTAHSLPYLTELKDGQFRLGEEARLLFMPFDHKRFYKHLLAGPYLICHPYENDLDRVEILLYNSVLQPLTVFVDQIAVRKSLLMSPGVMDVVTEMYYDRESKRPKKIALPAHFPKGSATVKRFGTVFNQLSIVWDVVGMPADEIKKILPSEFQTLLAPSAQ